MPQPGCSPISPARRTTSRRHPVPGSSGSQARSPVHRDWKGEIELIGDAEAPTRIIKQLGQLWRACGVLGLDAEESWEVVRRCALDSIPKLRGAVIRYLDARTEAADTTTVGIGVVHPTRTVRRALKTSPRTAWWSVNRKGQAAPTGGTEHALLGRPQEGAANP